MEAHDFISRIFKKMLNCRPIWTSNRSRIICINSKRTLGLSPGIQSGITPWTPSVPYSYISSEISSGIPSEITPKLAQEPLKQLHQGLSQEFHQQLFQKLLFRNSTGDSNRNSNTLNFTGDLILVFHQRFIQGFYQG